MCKPIRYFLKNITRSKTYYIINYDCEVFEKLPDTGFTIRLKTHANNIKNNLPDSKDWDIDIKVNR